MKEKLKQIKIDHVVQALIVIAIGIVLIVWAPALIPIMARILAALLFLIGVVFVIAYIFKKERGFIESGQFAVGILIAAVGVWIFLNPETFTDFIPKIFGVFIILSGIRNLSQTLALIRSNYGLWWLSLILALITLGLGGFLLFRATEAKELFVRIIGGFLLFDGASNLWTISRVAKYARTVQQAARDAEAVEVEAEIVDSKPTIFK